MTVCVPGVPAQSRCHSPAPPVCFKRDISWYTSPVVVDTTGPQPRPWGHLWVHSAGVLTALHLTPYSSRLLLLRVSPVGQCWGVSTGFLWNSLARSPSSHSSVLSLLGLFSILFRSHWDPLPDQLPWSSRSASKQIWMRIPQGQERLPEPALLFPLFSSSIFSFEDRTKLGLLCVWLPVDYTAVHFAEKMTTTSPRP